VAPRAYSSTLYNVEVIIRGTYLSYGQGCGLSGMGKISRPCTFTEIAEEMPCETIQQERTKFDFLKQWALRSCR